VTRIYYYTDGTTATSISGSSPLPFGTARTRQTTRAGIYDEVVAALIAAGWTQHNLTTRDDVWESTGESGGERIYVRTKYLVPGSPTTQNAFNWFVGTKIDGSNNLQGQIGTVSSSAAEDGWITSADTTFDHQILATKDFIWCNVRAVSAAGTLAANDQLNFFLGTLDRSGEANQFSMLLNTAASAGTFVTLDTTGYNPITLGYRPGDFIQIVALAAADAAAAQTCRISAVSSSSVTVDSLAASYSAGAILGAIPQPVVRFVSKNSNPTSTTQWTSALSFNPNLTSDLAGGTGTALNVLPFAVGTSFSDSADMGAGTTPGKRSGRFGCRSLSLAISSGVSSALTGRVPGLFAYPGTMSFFPHDTGTYNRTGTSERFIGIRFVTASTTPFMLGKMP
jgi:hypothetical protein